MRTPCPPLLGRKGAPASVRESVNQEHHFGLTDPNYISNYSSRRSLVHDEDTMIWDAFTFIGTVTCFGVRQLEIASPRVTFILS